MASERTGHEGSARLEAFSDAIFAIVTTLLVLDLKLSPLANGVLTQELENHWPSFLAFVTSFMTILIMWMNHSYVFNQIKRTDTRLMFLNGFLLLFVTLTPFTTSIVAHSILSSDANVAAAIYSGCFLLLSATWNILWRYASSGRRFLMQSILDDQVKAITFRCNLGLVFYLLALMVSFFSGLAAVAAIVTISGFWAVSTAISK